MSKREIEDLLNKKTGLQKEVINMSKEKSNLLNKISAAEELALANFRKQGSKRIDYCDFGTREKCQQSRNTNVPCTKSHFKKIIRPHTDENLGNCSYLDTCRHMDYCKFVHYVLDVDMYNLNTDNIQEQNEKRLNPQWINCDLRYIDFNILGKFNVIMADPPWDIHMTLPYGTLKDREMKAMRVDILQEEGFIFLWVTGRAMELGRECLINWGYKRVEEVIWIKTNQLQRIIRTGRTGHWLNHSKEHCLVGIKGNPKLNRKVDCDVIVSEVRETSRKPDEIYNLIERLSPGGKKIELFGRPHNTMPGWLTLGNQLPGIYLEDQDIVDRYQDAYPDSDLSKEEMERNKIRMKNENDIENIYNSHIQNIPPFKTKQLQKDLSVGVGLGQQNQQVSQGGQSQLLGRQQNQQQQQNNQNGNSQTQINFK
ncbi:methyltransferase like 3, putative [Ichthyophthirius multifiliis]|uniref:Methyltransferase like 3, putative n=1 Tax=Ichthyophthirius multifiliis TaxID=5932 RepID=G0QWI0_ICHMU|nr:methyltransferase like 3, putative [Ichthyophthirius multifiliis]EGR30425.1 methyltransferase like 3, putative [Ichthyophthirius multifiliis]|eukprot:XP_004032012.1 methyltransferase like 3, putative [Ichthyophthirius multifiliis]